MSKVNKMKASAVFLAMAGFENPNRERYSPIKSRPKRKGDAVKDWKQKRRKDNLKKVRG